MPQESEQLYRRWIVEAYNDSTDIVIRNGSGFKDDLERTLTHIANTNVQHDECPVLTDDSAHTNGTLTLRSFNDKRHQVVNILNMVQETVWQPSQKRIHPYCQSSVFSRPTKLTSLRSGPASRPLFGGFDFLTFRRLACGQEED